MDDFVKYCDTKYIVDKPNYIENASDDKSLSGIYAFIIVKAHHGEHLVPGTFNSSSAEECGGGGSQIDESVGPSGWENMPSLFH